MQKLKEKIKLIASDNSAFKERVFWTFTNDNKSTKC